MYLVRTDRSKTQTHLDLPSIHISSQGEKFGSSSFFIAFFEL